MKSKEKEEKKIPNFLHDFFLYFFFVIGGESKTPNFISGMFCFYDADGDGDDDDDDGASEILRKQ